MSVMDLRLIASVFALIFVAELGDKTQLATMALVAGGKPRAAVFIGASLALLATTALGVIFGEAVTRVVSPLWLKRIAGAGFIILGTLFLTGKA
jgi:putative Ca2+/H+ antiporter (TMEM165/GDT1 family)